MMKSKNTKRTLISGFLAMLLCSAMFMGTTYAWFVTSASNTNNRIEAGDLEIGLYQVQGTGEDVTETPITEDTKFFDDAKWKPGAVYYANFRVKNEGDLSLKYELALKWTSYNFIKQSEDAESGPSLTDVLQMAVVKGAIVNAEDALEKLNAVTQGGAAKAYTGSLPSVINTGKATDELAIIVYWPSGESDSVYNVDKNSDLSDEGNVLFADLGLVLLATQNSDETDSFGAEYDVNAEYPSEEVNDDKE